MFGGSSHTKLPHALRFTIFLLRIVIGLTFFYLGYASLWDLHLGLILQSRSVAGLYLWLAHLSSPAWLVQAAPWAFLVIGACLILGLFTRFAALVGAVLVLYGYLPGLTYTFTNVVQFINDELIVAICLLVLVAAKAGNYLGLDAVLHIGFRKKEKV
ncbi:MAG TPA: DoxX family membrane protein [Candidatus Paceibacterota bacterium]|nr:DoxX family membrane protein [Candidatus Paceibacterota bacterium]